MRISGRTLVNLAAKKDFFISEDNSKATYSWSNMKNLYKAGIYTIKNITGKILVWNIHKIDNDNWVKAITVNSSSTITLEENQYIRNIQALSSNGFIIDDSIEKILSENVIILDNNQVDVIDSIKYFEGLKSFGEEEKVEDKYKISILSSGKNLLKKELDTVGQEITIPKIGDYTFSFDSVIEGGRCGVYIIYEGKTLVSKAFNNGRVNLTLNIQQTEGLIVKVGAWDSGSKVVSINNSMMVEGVEATSYESYKSDKKDILIKEPLREGDYLYEDNGQVKVYRDVKQYTFTGNESFRILQPKHTNTLSVIVENIIDSKCTISNSMYRMCNNFFIVDTNARDIEGYNVHLNSVRFNILKSKLNTPDIEGFKAWLKANPTTIVYQLAEPTVEIVENCVDIDLDTFGEKTYFNILNSLPGTLDFKVPSNIASIVQNTAREVNNIWDVINNLLVPSLIDINKNVAMSTIKNNLK